MFSKQIKVERGKFLYGKICFGKICGELYAGMNQWLNSERALEFWLTLELW